MFRADAAAGADGADKKNEKAARFEAAAEIAGKKAVKQHLSDAAAAATTAAATATLSPTDDDGCCAADGRILETGRQLLVSTLEKAATEKAAAKKARKRRQK